MYVPVFTLLQLLLLFRLAQGRMCITSPA
uniref:Uncharacterized protein n=1 Tax=Anguilla anguilla TaxID=7936 RepID=A0A0E9XNU9_ANGAN